MTTIYDELNLEWDNFTLGNNGFYIDDIINDNNNNNNNNNTNSENKKRKREEENNNSLPPLATNIYVSTMTKVAQISWKTFDLVALFWKIPIMEYGIPKNGIIKKQMKMVSYTKEEVRDIQLKIREQTKALQKCSEHVISSIDIPNGHVKFKDIRKISIGIDKKDILHRRSRPKSAFYNCMVLMIRLRKEEEEEVEYKEYHVKIFNTGKIGIPGIQDDRTFFLLIQIAIEALQPFCLEKLAYRENSLETILINTNFNCGYFINRELLYDILVRKYNIQAGYEPCSYPGIQCTFYYDSLAKHQFGYIKDPKRQELYQRQKKKNNKANPLAIKEVSFMIFRTGSVLISGKKHENTEDILAVVYEFLKKLFYTEYYTIRQIGPVHLDIFETKREIINKKKKTFVLSFPS